MSLYDFLFMGLVLTASVVLTLAFGSPLYLWLNLLDIIAL